MELTSDSTCTSAVAHVHHLHDQLNIIYTHLHVHVGSNIMWLLYFLVCSCLVQTDNKQMRDTIKKLEQENEHLTRELVASKAGLREEMDKVRVCNYVNETIRRNYYLLFFVQLEERIDTLSKEGRAQKTSSDAAQQLIGELREELQQVNVVNAAVNKIISNILSSVYQLSGWPSGLRRQTQEHHSCPHRGFEDFWSTYVGVGSNPTSDIFFLLFSLFFSFFFFYYPLLLFKK